MPSETDRNALKLAHDVFFTLNDDSPEAQQKLVDACHRHLAGHDGVVSFAAGTLVPDLQRPVNDRAYQVSLHLIFQTRAHHDAYQTSPRHLAFIEENRDNWKQVRVFDSNVS